MADGTRGSGQRTTRGPAQSSARTAPRTGARPAPGPGKRPAATPAPKPAPKSSPRSAAKPSGASAAKPSAAPAARRTAPKPAPQQPSGRTPSGRTPSGRQTSAPPAQRAATAPRRTDRAGGTRLATPLLAPSGRTPSGRSTSARTPSARTTTGARTTSGRGPASGSRPAARQNRPAARPVRRRPPRRPRLGDPDLRLRVVLVVVFLVMTVLGGRLVQMQGLDSSQVAAAALENRLRTVPLPAHRGDITDAGGKLLAWTVERRNVLVDQNQVKNFVGTGTERAPEGVKGAARVLAPVLGTDPKVLAAKLSGTSKGAYVAKDVTPEVYRRVLSLNVPGIGGEPASRRVYPAQAVGSQVVGFLSKDGKQALGGIESVFDAQLRGTDGTWTYERSGDKYRAQIPTGVNEQVEPVDGVDVKLTIDQDIQWKAQQVLDAQMAKVDGDVGYVVVMTKTGQILALASSPGFDAADPWSAPQENLANRALTDVFEPGSTSKVITLAAAIEEGAVTPATRMTIPNTLQRSDRTFHDAESHGTEKLTVAGVMAKSSNIGTIQAGEKLSPQEMYGYMTRFGLGAKTGVGLSESKGLLAPPERWSGSQRYTMMFGQGLAVTALQSADVFATIANDGVRVAPRIVAGTTSPDGVFDPAPAAPTTRVVSRQTAQQVRLMMESVVGEQGTGENAKIPGYRVAGKTGTSQYADPNGGGYLAGAYTASFIGMAPADSPELVVAVVIQKPKNGHFGGTVSAPVFQQVMSYALTKRQVPPTLTKRPDLPLTWK